MAVSIDNPLTSENRAGAVPLESMHETPTPARIQAYADDFLVIVGDHNPEVLRYKANAALATLAAWSNNMKLQFSPAKTQWYSSRGITDKSS